MQDAKTRVGEDYPRPTADLAAVIAYADKMAYDLWGDWDVSEGPQTSEAEWQRVRGKALRAAVRPAVGEEGLRAVATDLLGEVGFMRSRIASGEKLSPTDLDRQNGTMSRAVSLLASKPSPEGVSDE